MEAASVQNIPWCSTLTTSLCTLGGGARGVSLGPEVSAGSGQAKHLPRAPGVVQRHRLLNVLQIVVSTRPYCPDPHYAGIALIRARTLPQHWKDQQEGPDADDAGPWLPPCISTNSRGAACV